MADDTLTPEQVAEDRQWFRDALGGDIQVEAIRLCDTIDALRGQLRETEEARDRAYRAGYETTFAEQKEQVHRLTAALRDANQAIEAASSVMTDKQVAEAAEIQRRALAEMGESDG